MVVMPGSQEQYNLTAREMDILHLLVAGEPNKVIARRLSITEATVKVHLRSLLKKINAANRTQAAIWALHHGFANSAAPTGAQPA
jgi:two-component system nitrate/nitrite response regulator NarL